MTQACSKHPEKPGTHYCAKYNRYLCDECLTCQDQTLFCKHRTSCVIWEIGKYGTSKEQEEAKTEDLISNYKGRTMYKSSKVTFLPSGKTIEVENGQSITEAAEAAEVFINARCGGKGVCGACKVKIEEGQVKSGASILIKDEDIEKGMVLACKSEIVGDISIRVPEEKAQQALQIVQDGSDIRESILAGRATSPMVHTLSLELDPPSLDNPSSDLDRVTHAILSADPGLEPISIELEALRELAKVLRENEWKINLTLLDHGTHREIIQSGPIDPDAHTFGLAIDVGTTSVVVYLVDLNSGDVAGISSALNEQVVLGEDVITRIISAKDEKGLERLHEYGIHTINSLILELLKSNDIEQKEIVSVAMAGNTVMTQSILKLDPASVRLEPYVPMAVHYPILHASDIDLMTHPRAGIYMVPGNAAYVGGDITAGIAASGLHQEDEITLFIDVGTNGEMVLGNRDWMMTAACSAGPAFEGGGIRHGMRAMPGAVEDVEINQETGEATVRTVDEKPAVGICGSGMISLISSLLLSGLIDTSGKFTIPPITDLVRDKDGDREYVVVRQEDSGLEEDVVITEADLSTLIRSKAAVYGGIRTLLESSGMTLDAIDHIRVAGGFGKHIDFDKAVIMGLLPEVDEEKFEYLGNSSIAGAYLALMSGEVRDQLHNISSAMTYIDFSSSTQFFDEYSQAMFLPHTEMRDFPGVAARLKD